MIALVGDAELDEGNIFEALLEGWKNGLRNTWWVIDYNRQSLDAVVREGLYERFIDIFRSFGWDVVVLKYGKLQEAAFAEPGGGKLRAWIDGCPNPEYSTLVFQGGAAWRKRLLDDLGDQGDLSRLIEKRSDDELARLMTNLAGHDLASVTEAFESIDHDRPVCFLAYTVKGFGLPFAGHKDNHAGLMTAAQMQIFRDAMHIRPGHEWDAFAGLSTPPKTLQQFLDRVPFGAKGARRLSAPPLGIPDALAFPAQPVASTQQGFGQILNELAREKSPLADRLVTTSPDVTVSTNLGPFVNRRGLFGREALADVFKRDRIPSTFAWDISPKGQHFELGIAENNLFLMLAALGLSHSLFGERLFPVGTLYDPFIARGLDAPNYACYQTPASSRRDAVRVSLAPEGGAHQSIGTPLIGMAQDGIAAFEPAFVDELAAILGWSFDYLQRSGEGLQNVGTGCATTRRLGLSPPLDAAARTASRTLDAT
jgi:pyruvate dehydrogenase E1 component